MLPVRHLPTQGLCTANSAEALRARGPKSVSSGAVCISVGALWQKWSMMDVVWRPRDVTSPHWLKVLYSSGANRVSLVTHMSGWGHRVWNWILIGKLLNGIGWFILYVQTYISGGTDLGARASKDPARLAVYRPRVGRCQQGSSGQTLWATSYGLCVFGAHGAHTQLRVFGALGAHAQLCLFGALGACYSRGANNRSIICIRASAWHETWCRAKRGLRPRPVVTINTLISVSIDKP